jgi:allantoicase
LGRSGRVRRIEIDTAHFKGNFPESASVEGCRRGAQGLHADDLRTGTDIAWTPILVRTRLEADRIHTFEIASSAEPVDHLRLSIYPDGGVSRLRVFCEPDWNAPA